LSLDGYIPMFLRIVVPSYSRLRNRSKLPDPVAEGITILSKYPEMHSCTSQTSCICSNPNSHKYMTSFCSKRLIHLLRLVWKKPPVRSQQLLVGGLSFLLPFTAPHLQQLQDSLATHVLLQRQLRP